MADDITREEEGSKGRYVLRRDGAEAEMTFSRLSPTRIIVDHTGVPPDLRGQGAGEALVERLVVDARAEGFTVVPLCPFVAVQARRRGAEWADVFQT